MSVRVIAEKIWVNAKFLPFTLVSRFKPFSNSWFAEHHPDLACGKDSKRLERLKGWYWIVTNLSDSDLQAAESDMPTVERQSRGSGRYTSIGERARKTLRDIGSGSVCAATLGDLRVVYNGHEGWARGRLGGHYESLDPRIGALRISQHANLRNAAGTWGAAIFTEEMIPSLPLEVQPLAEQLVASKLGRTVIEMEWRSLFGWPLLCRG